MVRTPSVKKSASNISTGKTVVKGINHPSLGFP
jgi:hypothetical protein